MKKHEKEAEALFAELDAQLAALVEVVPDGPLEKLRKSRFWVEWRAKKDGAMEYHRSAGWLKDNGYNPDKLGDVEINNAKNAVSWSKATQPWMVLHELAHAYHFRALGEGHEGIEAAYKQAMDRKLYDAVKHVGGGTEKAYAATNSGEYFAELSEAYFGTNDFFPFARGELAKHDPVGFKLMKDVWGEPKGAKK